MYTQPTTVIETSAGAAAGKAKPSQRPMVVTSYGRGRRNAPISIKPMTWTTMTLPRNANRWRQRLHTIVATSRTRHTADKVHPVAIRSTPRAMDVSQPVRIEAIARSTAASAWSVTRRAHEDNRAIPSHAMSTAVATIHPRPVRPM